MIWNTIKTKILSHLFLVFFYLSSAHSYAMATLTDDSESFAIQEHHGFYQALQSTRFPDNRDDLDNWLKSLDKKDKPSLFGGRFFTYFEVENNSSTHQWVYSPYNIVASSIVTQVYTSDGVTRFEGGEQHPSEYPFHYGHAIEIPANEKVLIVSLFVSDAFYTPPKLKLVKAASFDQQVIWDNLIITLCFGVGLVLGLYNLLIYIGSKDRTHLYYAVFTVCWLFAWSHFFHIPSQLFHADLYTWHWIGFILIPLTNTLFYVHLLRLYETHPRFAHFAITYSWLALIGIPLSMLSPGAGFIWATISTGIALCLGVYIGVTRLIQGFKPARYFVLAYLAMALPNMVGNLTNLGLLPTVEVNLYKYGLIGMALDALLLAFALADKFRLVNQANVELTKNLEVKVQERTKELEVLATELRDASEAKSRFLANMSHEIRTPMTSIIGYADGLMLGDIKPNEYLQANRIIAQNARHVLGLINDILDMSKIEANKLEVDKSPIKLFSIISQVESLLGKQIRDKGLQFNLNYHFPLPEVIITDANRLRQILLNLTANALKFTTVGRITIDVRVHNERLKIDVKDTGIGMSVDEQEQLFEAFYQADSTISRKYGGTGLGLNISKTLAQKLGGTITVKSAIGHGTMFTVDLTLEVPEQTKWVDNYKNAFEPEQEPPAPVLDNSLNGNVLLAEDHPDNAVLLTRILERMGLQVTVVENGQEAVSQALSQEFDLILMDIQMPIMDGEQALSFIQSIGCATPVIALTANTMSHEVERYKKLGFCDHLSKPVDRQQFCSKIAHYLSLPPQFDIDLPAADMKALKEQYIRGLEPQRIKMQNQLSYGDADGIRKSIHAIKGSASMFGCETLQELANQADQAVKEGDKERTKRLGEEMIEHMLSLSQQCDAC